MGRKRTAEQKRKFAEGNGYNDDGEMVDNNPVPRNILPYTREKYSVQGLLWTEYTRTHPDADPHTLKTLKHFAEFMARTIPGLLDPSGKPTVQTVRNHFRCFISGWNLNNPLSRISADLKDSITNYIKGPLKDQISLSTATRPKTFLTIENYMHVERQLWQQDGHEYIHDGYRVLISAKLKCHVFTPARLGEISEGSTRRKSGHGLRYGDTAMIVAWKDGRPELRYSLKREFAKGMHDKEAQRPTHILYEQLPDQPLVVQPLVFILAISLAAGAFKRYHSIEEILAVQPPADQQYWALEWADHVSDLPVFPTMTSEGSTKEIQSGTSFNKQLRDVCTRAGMAQPGTIHSSRRESLIQATGRGYPKDELMKFAAHTNDGTLRRDYLSTITSVDGVASFLHMPLRSDQAEDFRSMTVRRNPELLLSLPAKERDELQSRSDWVSIGLKLEKLSRQTKLATELTKIYDIQQQRDQLLDERRLLEAEELNRLRRDQQRIHPAERGSTFHVDKHRSRFDRLRHMMPERDRLSGDLFNVAPLRSDIGRSVIKDLVSLMTKSCQVAYQPTIQPLRGLCPRAECSAEIERLNVERRWRHVFECSKPTKDGSDSAEFCFICSLWIADYSNWDRHCQEHIERNELPTRCDFVKFRRAIACPGRCLTCMHNEALPAAKRLQGFMKQVSWENHVNECYMAHTEKFLHANGVLCPDPRCAIVHETEATAWYHLQDAHSYPLRNPRARKAVDGQAWTSYVTDNNKRRRLHLKQEPEPSKFVRTNVDKPEPSAWMSDGLRGVNEENTSADFTPNELLHHSKMFHGNTQLDGSEAKSLMQCDLMPHLGFKSQSSVSVLSLRDSGSLEPSFSSESSPSGSLTSACLSNPPTEAGVFVSVDLLDPRLQSSTPLSEDDTAVPHLETQNQLIGDVLMADCVIEQRPPVVIDEEQDIWEVDELLAKRKRGNRICYLVKWKGFLDEDNSWEPPQNISDDLLDSFDIAYTSNRGNYLGVTILGSRQGRRGSVEYLLKWQGRPDSESSWESEATISPSLIQRFLADSS